jgi:YidC/Oxa1 family membrane protein insertase
MTNPNLWNQLLIWPITNLLVLFYKLFEFLHIPGPLGFAIILLTAFIRLLLYPLMHAQLSNAKKMSDLKPHLDALNAKHKNDKTQLQQAQLALYKEHGVNPAAGCLPTLIQFPILIALYNVFYQLLGSKDIGAFLDDINKILYAPFLHLTNLDFSFFGLNLAVKPGEWQKYGWWLLAIPLLTALLQWYQSKLMLPASTPKTNDTEKKIEKSKKGKEDQKTSPDEKKIDDMMEMQKQMVLITPVMFGFFALQLPIGLALYWNVFGLFGIMQQLKINKSK